jgi:hypothetical protein
VPVPGRLSTYGVVVGGVDLSGVLLSLSWGGSVADLADHASFRVGVEPRRATALGATLPNGARCDVIADGQVVLQGVVFAVDEVEEPEMAAYEVTVYDPMTYLARSEEDIATFTDLSAPDIIALIGYKTSFPIGTIALPGHILFPPKSFIGEKPGDILAYLCDQVGLFTGEVYAPRWDGGLSIARVGGGAVTATLTGYNSSRVRTRQDMEDLVTAVKVTGNYDPTGNLSFPESVTPTGGLIDPRPTAPVTPPPITRGQEYLDQFGRLQKILKTSDFKSAAEAQAAAAEILRVYGSPRQEQTFLSFDVPSVRKCDQVQVNDLGSASGLYTVTSVQHDAGANMMTIVCDSRALLHVRTGSGVVTDPATQVRPVPVGAGSGNVE